MKFLIIVSLLAAITCFTSCSLTITPDGSRQFVVDGDQAARAIIRYSGK